VSGFLLLLFNIYFYSMSKEKRISVRTEESEVNKIETKTKNKQKINKEPKKLKSWVEGGRRREKKKEKK